MCRLRNLITHVPTGLEAQSSVVHVFSNGSNSASSWSRSRFAANQAATASFSRCGDVHASVARRLADAGCGLVLDAGGGNGVLARELAKVGVRTVTVDRATYVADAPRPALRTDALTLPFRELSFPGTASGSS